MQYLRNDSRLSGFPFVLRTHSITSQDIDSIRSLVRHNHPDTLPGRRLDAASRSASDPLITFRGAHLSNLMKNKIKQMRKKNLKMIHNMKRLKES